MRQQCSKSVEGQNLARRGWNLARDHNVGITVAIHVTNYGKSVRIAVWKHDRKAVHGLSVGVIRIEVHSVRVRVGRRDNLGTAVAVQIGNGRRMPPLATPIIADGPAGQWRAVS